MNWVHKVGEGGGINWFHRGGGEGFKGSRTRYWSTGVISTWAWGLCFEYVLVINVLLFQWLAHYKKVAVKLLLVI